MTVTANSEGSTKSAAPKKGKTQVAAQSTDETKTEGTPDQTPTKTDDENQKVDEQVAGDTVQKNDAPDETKSEVTPDQTPSNTADENQKGDEPLGDEKSKVLKQVPDQLLQKASTKDDVSPENDESKALGPLELAVINHGANTHCNLTRTNLPQNERVVIQYKTPGAKKQAQLNFAQLNALAGKSRFKVEG